MIQVSEPSRAEAGANPKIINNEPGVNSRFEKTWKVLLTLKTYYRINVRLDS